MCDDQQTRELLKDVIVVLTNVANSLADLQQWSGEKGDTVYRRAIHETAESIRQAAERLRQESLKVFGS